MICRLADTTVTPGTPGTADTRGRRRGGGGNAQRPAPEDVLYWPDVVMPPDERPCVTLRREVAPGAAVSPLAPQVETNFQRLTAIYPMCPRVVVPPANPTFVARSFFEQVDLPEPHPYIAPGFAITGKDAFLETRGSLHPAPFATTTALGPIRLTATARYLVDWGDGSPAERFALEGGPWPDGRIVHTYTVMGSYDVVVTAEWQADWQVGSRTGTLSGVRTSGRIDDFDVRQVQAVGNW